MQTTIQLDEPSLATSRVTFRKDIDKDAFLQDLKNAVEKLHSVDSAEDITREYNATLQNIADSYAPTKNRIIKARPQAEWYKLQLQSEKRRKCERRYRRTRTSEDARLFKEQSDHYCSLLISTRQQFYREKIESCANDQKAMFTVLNKHLHRVSESQLPVRNDLSTLVNRFADFFTEKMTKIRESFDKHQL